MMTSMRFFYRRKAKRLDIVDEMSKRFAFLSVVVKILEHVSCVFGSKICYNEYIYRREQEMEYLDIRDKDGNLTGEVKERSLVHEDGDIHGTSHVWIVRKNDKGSCDLLLQKRSENKDAFPGCYDISSAGHLPAGQDYLESALRELEEELGIKADPEQLHFIGMHEGTCEEVFYGKLFKNYEISRVYLYQEPVNIEELTLQEEEVEEVRWLDFETCCKKTEEGDKEYCLFPEELKMIKQYLKF